MFSMCPPVTAFTGAGNLRPRLYGEVGPRSRQSSLTLNLP